MTRKEKKSYLREQIGLTVKNTTYSITILKVADKKVTILESINGIRHEHTWFNIEEAYNYYAYKKILNRELSKKRNEIDLKYASLEYKNQKSTHATCANELEIFLRSKINNVRAIEFVNDRKIQIMFEDTEDTIDINIRNTIEQEAFIRLNTTNDIAMTVAETHAPIALGILQSLNWNTTNTILARNASFEFHELLQSYRDITIQLEKFTTATSSDIIFPIESQDIIDFVNIAKDGQSIIIELEDSMNRSRQMHIVRQTRIKYLIEVRNYRDVENEDMTSEIMQEEYWFYISKFSANFTDNIELLRKTYAALA